MTKVYLGMMLILLAWLSLAKNTRTGERMYHEILCGQSGSTVQWVCK